MVLQLAELNWPQVKKMNKDETILILPISSLEQHGRHLPFGTDDYLLKMVLSKLYTDERVESEFLCLPALSIGMSFEHILFAGTMSLSGSTIVSIINDILYSMSSQGFSRLVIINSHGGNKALLKAFPCEWATKYGIQVFQINLNIGDVCNTADNILQGGISVDIHAGESETSMMMYGHPKLVDESQISEDNDNPVVLKSFYSGWFSSDLSEDNGVMGKASFSTKDKGEVFLKLTVDDVVQKLNNIANYK